ncbi:MAG: hypothetical protein V6Z81_09270 [Parvularculales bacterium]
MILSSFLSQGVLQTLIGVEHAYMGACPAGFVHSPIAELFGRTGVSGDIVLSVGAVAVALLMLQSFWKSSKVTSASGEAVV